MARRRIHDSATGVHAGDAGFGRLVVLVVSTLLLAVVVVIVVIIVHG